MSDPILNGPHFDAEAYFLRLQSATIQCIREKYSVTLFHNSDLHIIG